MNGVETLMGGVMSTRQHNYAGYVLCEYHNDSLWSTREGGGDTTIRLENPV